jgi:hypothetical protein
MGKWSQVMEGKKGVGWMRRHYLDERNLEVGALADNSLLNTPDLVENDSTVSGIDCSGNCEASEQSQVQVITILLLTIVSEELHRNAGKDSGTSQ